MTHSDLKDRFNQWAINDRIDPFFDDDIESYFSDPNQFSLNIKRSKTKVALYGSVHVGIRQQWFNQCSLQDRNALLVAKATAAGIDGWLSDQLGVPLNRIESVSDVGKGRTIYKISVAGERSYVLKEKTNRLV